MMNWKIASVWLLGLFLLIGCDDGDSPQDAGLDADGDAESDADQETESDADQETDDDGGDADSDVDGSELLHVDCAEGCENLNPLYCPYPFPSDRYLTTDDSHVTGYRLDYTPEFLPAGAGRSTFDFAPFLRLDGMSPATQIMTLFDAPPDLTNAATVDAIGRSLEADSPTVILDLTTGERVPHWVELDARAESEDRTIVYLRLAGRLTEDHAYAVALRSLSTEAAEPLQPSDAFRAIRDGIPTDCDSLEERRPGLEATLDELDEAGIERSELQIAWRFHTASGEAIRGDLLHMREDALERLGPDGIGCTVTSVEEGYGDDGHVWRRVRGTYTVPSYVDSPNPPARLIRGDDGYPEYQGELEAPFTMIIPTSLATSATPGPIVAYGHGLLGNGEGEISSGGFRELADELGVVMVATDWAGMSADDTVTVADAVTNPTNFVNVTDRLQQGMINQIALTRTFAGVCRDIPEATTESDVSLLDPDELYYVGGSQGGIFGGTLLTISPDIERGVLIVGGVVYPFMIERSIDFEPFEAIYALSFPDRLDRALVLPFVQHLLDAAEPSGYIHEMLEGLPGIGPKQVLAIAAVNDAQVPNLATDQAMRMIGTPLLEGTARTPWGFEVVTPPYEGSAYISIDTGDPPVPEGNLAPEEDYGGHGDVGYTAASLQMIDSFLRREVIEFDCDGICDPD